MKTKHHKNYPMDGPPRHIQRLMERPRQHASELKKWLKDNPNMRPETRDAIKWAVAN